MLGVIEQARTLSPESSLLVLPSRIGGRLARNAPGRVLRRAGIASTVHVFPSSARSWMVESGVLAEVAEASLAHVPRSQVVQRRLNRVLQDAMEEPVAEAGSASGTALEAFGNGRDSGC